MKDMLHPAAFLMYLYEDSVVKNSFQEQDKTARLFLHDDDALFKMYSEFSAAQSLNKQ